MKMTLHLTATYSVALVFLIGALSGCAASDAQVQEQIAAQVARGDGTVVRLADVTPFSWERLHVYPPYTPSEQVEEELGFRWRGADRIEMLDRFTLLVFVANDRVVAFVEHPRRQGDFAELHTKSGYRPNEAEFVVATTHDGWAVMRRASNDVPSDDGLSNKPQKPTPAVTGRACARPAPPGAA